MTTDTQQHTSQDVPPFGERLRFFRRYRGLSQTALELKMGKAQNSLSAIETGKTTPTNETIQGFVRALELNIDEANYLTGITAVPCTPEEDERAKEEILHLLKPRKKKRKWPGILMDDRYRIVAFSDYYRKMLKYLGAKHEYDGRNFIEYLTEHDSPCRRFTKPEYWHEDIGQYIARYYYRRPYLMLEPKFRSMIERLIDRYDYFAALWEDVETGKIQPESTPYTRFRLSHGPVSFTLYAQEMPLLRNQRYIFDFDCDSKIPLHAVLPVLPSFRYYLVKQGEVDGDPNQSIPYEKDYS